MLVKEVCTMSRKVEICPIQDQCVSQVVWLEGPGKFENWNIKIFYNKISKLYENMEQRKFLSIRCFLKVLKVVIAIRRISLLGTVFLPVEIQVHGNTSA